MPVLLRHKKAKIFPFAAFQGLSVGGVPPGLIWHGVTSNTIFTGTPTLPYNTGPMNIGTASSDRFVVIAFAWNSSATNGDLTGVKFVQASNTNAIKVADGYSYGSETHQSSLWYANLPTGTTANIVFTAVGGSGWINEGTVIVGYFTGSNTAAPVVWSSVSPPAIAGSGGTDTNFLQTLANTGQLAIFSAISAAAVSTSNWGSNATLDIEVSDGIGVTGTLAHANASANVVEIVTNGGSIAGFVEATFDVWGPTQLPGLIGWYNAQPGNYTANSTTILTVKDLSPANNNLTLSGTAVPYVAASAYNSQPAFGFNQNGELVNTSFSANIVNSQLNIMYIGQLSSSAIDFATIGGYYQNTSPGNSNSLYSYFPTGTVLTTQGAAANVSTDTNFRYVAVANGSQGTNDVETWINGTFINKSNFWNVALVNNQIFVLGANWSGSTYGNQYWGPIVEVIVWQGQSNSTIISLLDNYAVAKYGPSTPWSPAKLSGLVAWYKGDAGITLSGSTVTEWADQSGNGYHLYQNPTQGMPSGSAPTTSTLNGLTVVEFPLLNNGFNPLSTNLNAVPALNHANLSIIAVAQCTNSATLPTGGNDVVVAFLGTPDTGPSGSNNSTVLEFQPQTATPFILGIRGPTTSETLFQAATNTWYQIANWFDGTHQNLSVPINAAPNQAADTNTFGANTTLSVGGLIYNSLTYNGFVGYIAEVIITSAALTSADRTNLYDYLSNKWGVTT